LKEVGQKNLGVEAIIAGRFRDVFIDLTESSLVDLNRIPVLIPRDHIIRSILTTSMPIVVAKGDWGQGKSTIGKLLYRIVAGSKDLSVTYIPLMTIRQIVSGIQIDQRVLQREPTDPGSRRFLALAFHLFFSPNYMISNYRDLDGKILTSLDRSYELDPKEYIDKDLSGIARVVIERLRGIRYFIVLDEVEGVEGFFDHDRLGKILLFIRHVYDLLGGKSPITLVLLMQSIAYDEFLKFIDNVLLKSPALSRAYGVISLPALEIGPFSEGELLAYARAVTKRLTRLNLEDLVKNQNILYNIVKIAANTRNNRQAISVIRSFLSSLYANILAKTYRDNVQKLLSSSPGDLVELLRSIEPSKISSTELGESVVRIPDIIINIYEGNFSLIGAFAEDIARVTAQDLYRLYEHSASPPTPRSRARGYKTYQLIISSQQKKKPLRLLIWARLTRITKPISRKSLFEGLGLPTDEGAWKEDQNRFNTKVLFLFHREIRGALIQEVDPDLIIPIELSPSELASIVGWRLSGEAVIREEIDQEFLKALEETYKNSYIPKLKAIIDRLLK